MSFTRTHNDSSYVEHQTKALESELDYRVNINNFKNSNRCEKDGDLPFATRITLDSELKNINIKSGKGENQPLCTNAGACTPDEIKSAMTAKTKESYKFVNPALCFDYHTFAENNVPRPQVKPFDPSRFETDV